MKHCAKATMMMEQARFRRLGIQERISLAFHLSICDACRQYKKDSAALEHIIRHMADKASKTLSDEEKEAMVRNLGSH